VSRVRDRAQRRAAEALASVWVAASAGTGKTKVLTDRVLALMLSGSPPARILCLTFTKAAAAEMANRLNRELAQWTVLEDGKLAEAVVALTGTMPDADMLRRARRLFAEVLDVPGGMKIATIHAFCQSLLRRFPLEAGVAPHFSVMDERTAAEALDRARDLVLRMGPPISDRVAAVTRHANEKTFAELMAALILERGKLAAVRGDGLRERLRRRLDVPLDATEAGILAAACARGACAEAALAAAALAMEAGNGVTDRKHGAAIAQWLGDPAARIAGFDEYLAVFFTQKREPRQSLVGKDIASRSPAVASALAEEAQRLAEVQRRRTAAALAEASEALIDLGGALLDAYEREKGDRALLDYDDLVLKARALLERPGVAPWVQFKLDGGIDHILIDEAQDTNPDQWGVVAALADEFFAGASAREERRTIFAVGDSKQSIFSFQRADPDAFPRMRAHFAARVAAAEQRWDSVELDLSFRSTAPVLAAVDAVFARPEASAGVLLDGAPVRHTAHRQGQAGLVELWPVVEPEELPAAAPWESPLDQRRLREPPARLALAIAAQLRRWLDQGERLAARDRRLRPGDVLVLVRRRGPFVTELVRALKQQDVPVAGADRMRLVDQLAVQDMMALANFLLLPRDDLTLATLLKSPLFGFDDEHLFALAWGRGGSLWNALRRRAGDDFLYHRAATELQELLARADFVPSFELFAEVLGARGGRRDMLARLGPESADSLDELLAAALAYDRTEAPSLQGFLHWLGRGATDIKRDFDQGGRDEVRIMTVHGAKGLEAPVVFLPDTMQVPEKIPALVWTPEGLPLWRAHEGCAAPPLDAARAAAAARRDEEYRRLLYVAMTRAADRLYVCGWANRRPAPAGRWHALVAAGLGDVPRVERFDFETTSLIGADGWSGPGLRLATAQEGTPMADAVAAAQRALADPLPPWAHAPPPPEPTPPRPLAPSRPAGADPAVRSPVGGDGGAGFRRGRLVHALLQSLPELPAGARAAAARRFLAAPVHGLAPAAQDEVLRETMAVIAAPDFAPLFAPGSRAEVPIVGLIGDRALAGQIDRLVVTDEEVLIVDYKTLRPAPESEAEVPQLYRDQLRAYRAAIAAIYPGRRVRCALLWTDGPRLMPIGD
jgi:ATP-dependent helicase/nuclease subunit A